MHVVAGTNGAGKSSIAGAALRSQGIQPYDPDRATTELMAANPGLGHERANSLAWHTGRRLLERAIATDADFAFETTLGGRTITSLLERAAAGGLELWLWYVGLETPELHIERVRARVAAGGHDIPEGKIRERFDRSRENLIRLLPLLTELRLYDNSRSGDPARGDPPRPFLILHLARGVLLDGCDLADVPAWAKPIVMAAFESTRGR